MKKIGIFFLVCSVYIAVQAEIVPEASSTFSYENRSFYLSNNTKKRKIFVNDPAGLPPCKIGLESFCFDDVTVYKKGRTQGAKDSAILFVGTEKGLLSRLVFMDGYIEFSTKNGKLRHAPRYFKDDIAENVGGRITKIKNNSQGDVIVHYKRNLKSYKATYRFCISEWKKV